ncbi:MAG: hypothetical protein LBH16_10140 [Treponema sp.]|jgi:hypothetical protein|nr:hypothetical protein [Treponema sp.]
MKKLNKISLFALLTVALFIPALITSCQVPDAGANIPEGYGAVRINIGGMRTILPGNGAALASFANYKLVFTGSGSLPTLTFDRASSAITTPINLPYGSYSLAVTAYAGTIDNSNIAATATVNTVTIASGGSTSITIILNAIPIGSAGDTGTFSWNITFDSNITDLDEAEMVITPASSGSPVTVDLTTNPNNSQTYATGYYNVVFTLTREDESRFVFKQILWIYKNLTSNFTFEFKDEHFSTSFLSVSFNFLSWGDSDTLNENVTPGSQITIPTPTTQTGQYYYGWYTNEGDDPTDDSDWGDFHEAGASVTINTNMDFYLRWVDSNEGIPGSPSLGNLEPGKLTVTYDKNNGTTGTVDNDGSTEITLDLGDEDTLTVTVTNSGYTNFAWSWNDKPLGTTDTLSIDLSSASDPFKKAGTYMISVEAEDASNTPFSIYFTIIIED